MISVDWKNSVIVSHLLCMPRYAVFKNVVNLKIGMLVDHASAHGDNTSIDTKPRSNFHLKLQVEEECRFYSIFNEHFVCQYNLQKGEVMWNQTI